MRARDPACLVKARGGDRAAEDGYFYVSILTGLPGVATHAKDPCCFAWLSFDNRQGRFVADA